MQAETPQKIELSPNWATIDASALPTMHDLPHEDPTEPGLPDEFHGVQPQLLTEVLLSETTTIASYSQDQIFIAADLNIYYDPNHPNWYKRPDWFLVVGGTSLYRGQTSRSSYVMWDEKIPPMLMIEFISPGTEGEDLGRFAPKPPQRRYGKPPIKFDVYEKILQIPNYLVYNEETQELQYFRLIAGQYQLQPLATHNPRCWIPEIDLGIGLWHGQYRNRTQLWLRWCDRSGTLLPTPAEQNQATQQQLTQGVLNLLQMGLSETQIAQALGLSPDTIAAIRRPNP
jgi:Uma2 family endonuclease